jgi:hypothetical protein
MDIRGLKNGCQKYIIDYQIVNYILAPKILRFFVINDMTLRGIENLMADIKQKY